MAHKKAAGAAKNLRDSQPKYRGVKIFGGQHATKGNILIRQNGSKYECGLNTYLATDFTIHASADGIVHFKKKNFKRFDGRTYLKTVIEVLPNTTLTAESKPAKKAPTKKVENETVAEKPAKKTPAKKTAEKAEPKAKKAAEKIAEPIIETVVEPTAEATDTQETTATEA